jgi:hypothetical protein
MPALEVPNADAATTPVTVIEAKGHNSDPSTADVRRGINQAHGHLSEVNIGVIGVENRYDATLIEPARVTGVGNFSTTIDAIRFQATTHQLTEGSFPVNHPKNYLGYALALAANGDHV